MVLRALVDTWVRFVWKEQGGVTYEVANDRQGFIVSAPARAIQTIYLQAGDGLEFSHEAEGEYPVHRLAACYPERFVIEDESEMLH